MEILCGEVVPISVGYNIKWLSGLLCYNNASCKYWTWIEDYNGLPQKCYLKDANSGLSYLEGVISGGKNCIGPKGKDADLYVYLSISMFFPLFLTKSDKIHCPQCHLLPNTATGSTIRN